MTSVSSIKASATSAAKSVSADHASTASTDPFGDAGFSTLLGAQLQSSTAASPGAQPQGQTGSQSSSDQSPDQPGEANAAAAADGVPAKASVPASPVAVSLPVLPTAPVAVKPISPSSILLNGTQAIVIPQSSLLSQLGLAPKANPIKVSGSPVQPDTETGAAENDDATADTAPSVATGLANSATAAKASSTSAASSAPAAASNTTSNDAVPVKSVGVVTIVATQPASAKHSSADSDNDDSGNASAQANLAQTLVQAPVQPIILVPIAAPALENTQSVPADTNLSGAARKSPGLDITALAALPSAAPATSAPAGASAKTGVSSSGIGNSLATDSDDDDDTAELDADASNSDTASGKTDANAALTAPASDSAGNSGNQGSTSNNGNSGDPAKSQDFTQILQGDGKEKTVTAQASGPASFADAVKSAAPAATGQAINAVASGNANASNFVSGSGNTTSATSPIFVQATPEQVSVVLQRAASDKVQSITIALDPAELGKVEIKLNLGKDGAVQASITADRPETLALMKNDHGALNQALHDAGLNPDASSLSFNLRDNSQQQAQQNQNNQNGKSSSFHFEAAVPASAPTAHTLQASSNGRLDLLV